MRTIKQTVQFKGDLKREAKGRHRATLKREFIQLLAALANDQPLADKYRDHLLTSNWQNHRDCHIKPDLVLIYRKPNTEELQLVRLGSHSELCL